MSGQSFSGSAVDALDLLNQLETQSEPDTTLPLHQIKVLEGFNPRSHFNADAFLPEQLEGLMQSLRTHGILQPLVVRRQGSDIYLIAGERRLQAARLVGLTHVPVVIKEVTQEEAQALAIVENSQRQDLDIVTETLMGFGYLCQKTKMTEEELVAYLGQVRQKRRKDDLGLDEILKGLFGSGISSWSLQRAKILKLTHAEREAVRKGEISANACIELIRLPDHEKRIALLKKAIAEELSAKALKTLVDEQLNAQKPNKPATYLAAQELKKVLPRTEKLTGKEAEEAEFLIQKLIKLLTIGSMK